MVAGGKCEWRARSFHTELAWRNPICLGAGGRLLARCLLSPVSAPAPGPASVLRKPTATIELESVIFALANYACAPPLARCRSRALPVGPRQQTTSSGLRWTDDKGAMVHPAYPGPVRVCATARRRRDRPLALGRPLLPGRVSRLICPTGPPIARRSSGRLDSGRPSVVA